MAAAFSHAQLQSALWARAGARVHAVVDGCVVPGMPALLQAAQTQGFDCLKRGALAAAAAAQAAYVVELLPDSPFTAWLLGEAAGVYPDWGLLLTSTLSLLAMREHCRSLADVMTPDGRRRPWRWYDPQLFAAILPQFTPSQQDMVFAGGVQVIAPASTAWTWYSMVEGVLQTEARNVLQAKA